MVSDKGVKKVSGGMQMLVWQAAVAHTIWSGAEYTAEQVQAISDEMMSLCNAPRVSMRLYGLR